MFFLLLIAGCSYYLGKQSNSVITPTSRPITTAYPVQNFISSQTPVQTSNWQTYKNEKHGFTFNYPQGYIIEDRFAINQNVDSECEGYYTIVDIHKAIHQEQAQYPGINIAATQSTKDIQTFIDDCFKRELEGWDKFKMDRYINSPNPQIVSIVDASNGSISGKRILRIRSPNSPNEQETQYVFKKENIIYFIYATYGTYNDISKDKGDDEKRDTEMLFQTFRFLDQL